MKVMIGLETHVQLRTASKLFCACPTKSTGPNSNVCPICMGFPGTKPALNAKAVEIGTEIALALKCEIAPEMWFSRKSYFYPDLPKGYQITQYEVPLAGNGTAEFSVGGGKKKSVRIRRVHVEEDPAKLEHEEGIMNACRVLVDYSRSGTPLCEIVTEPDFDSAAEAKSYLDWLFSLLSYLEAIDPQGDAVMRSDANISIDGGERVEIKNITGAANVESALKSEINRQIGLLNLGKRIAARETRLFDDATGRTVALRRKEAEDDYGYIFEPDLPTVAMAETSCRVKRRMREMPEEALVRLGRSGVAQEMAAAIVFTPGLLAYFDAVVREYRRPVEAAKWISKDFLKCLNWNSFSVRDAPEPAAIVELLTMIDRGDVTERAAKDLIKDVVGKKTGPRELLAAVSAGGAESEENVIAGVIAANEKAVAEFKAGKTSTLQFLVGEVMKRSRARIDPRKARELLEKALSG